MMLQKLLNTTEQSVCNSFKNTPSINSLLQHSLFYFNQILLPYFLVRITKTFIQTKDSKGTTSIQTQALAKNFNN